MATWNPFVGFKAVGESTNPYGHSKLVCEDMLSALCASNSA